MLIDSHAHLTSEKYNRDRHEIIKLLQNSGIEKVITSGGSLESSVQAADLAEKYEAIYATVGINAEGDNDVDYHTLELLKGLARKKKVIAIGEIGLDYYHNSISKDFQKKWFIEQIRLANEVDLPIVVHDREANYDTFNIIKKEKEKDSRLRGVLHCYSGDLQLAKEYTKIGFYISIAGPVTYRGAKKLQEVVRGISLDFLFVETDAPYLPPGQIGKRRNEPAYVKYVAEAIAELKGVDFETVAKSTSDNVKRLFRI